MDGRDFWNADPAKATAGELVALIASALDAELQGQNVDDGGVMSADAKRRRKLYQDELDRRFDAAIGARP